MDSSNFPNAVRRKRTPAELERLLRSQECVRLLPPKVRQQALEQLGGLRSRLLRLVCSEAWFEHCWKTGEEFPPRADSTPMVSCQCPRCVQSGKLWPSTYAVPDAVPSGPSSEGRQRTLSYECYLESLSDWDAANLPSSPSGLALRAVREGRIRLRFQRTRRRRQ